MEDAANGAPKLASVLCVDDDRDVAEVVQAILIDEGYAVSCLYDAREELLFRAIGRLEPDVILLDSSSATDYGRSWDLAAAIHNRPRPVPVIMFTAHGKDVDEAAEHQTSRAMSAAFAALLGKPFDIDDLLGAVATAAGRSSVFDRSAEGEATRTSELVTALTAHGATDVRASVMREWALFRDARGHLLQLYWWQQQGVYQLGRYEDDGRMVMVGQFLNRDAAIEMALPS